LPYFCIILETMGAQIVIDEALRAAEALPPWHIIAAAMFILAALVLVVKALITPTIPSIQVPEPQGNLPIPFLASLPHTFCLCLMHQPQPPLTGLSLFVAFHQRSCLDILPPGRTTRVSPSKTPKGTIPCINPGNMELLGYAPAMTPTQVS
jgi:hypothetical protein